jgi:hypothetical protein
MLAWQLDLIDHIAAHTTLPVARQGEVLVVAGTLVALPEHASCWKKAEVAEWLFDVVDAVQILGDLSVPAAPAGA